MFGCVLRRMRLGRFSVPWLNALKIVMRGADKEDKVAAREGAALTSGRPHPEPTRSPSRLAPIVCIQRNALARF